MSARKKSTARRPQRHPNPSPAEQSNAPQTQRRVPSDGLDEVDNTIGDAYEFLHFASLCLHTFLVLRKHDDKGLDYRASALVVLRQGAEALNNAIDRLAEASKPVRDFHKTGDVM